ncbi:efflux RND transporter permease subunit [Candidatus Methylacidithermus pantelleriae]|uniref:Cation/multidrug efflux pump n=1 Tax=Candidatus Methylacidithermus pantelleriae TaxID=2744239 RepID=A0A8J2BL40_9BACT|nr:efflux RND transporter permease subunit [Candidatus Methylacidithermus pantelleriae]CAF0698336.1 Cation/multidrug efflux pump [Candidatus Methylacidithermus pantelleriae]
MWIVRLALRQPFTIAVMAVAILILGLFTISTTPTDIFPEIDIPVVTIVWQYLGLPPREMQNYITTLSDYSIANYVEGVKRVESTSYYGFSITRVYFQPGVDISLAIAQVEAILQPNVKRMPVGTTPPLIFRFNASEVPILQIGVSSPTLSDADLADYALYQLRRDLLSVRGATMPPPWGGNVRWMTVDVNPNELLARGLSADQVLQVVNSQVVDLPSGDVKIGNRDYLVSLNNVPSRLAEINDYPIKKVDPPRGTLRIFPSDRMIYVRDIGHIHEGGAPQWNLVRSNGIRGTLLTVLKGRGASTIEIVDEIKKLLPELRKANPRVTIKELFDQSLYVRAAIKGVVTEGLMAATLTGLMILLFLGSWRSTLIVLTSIPLCVLVALFVLSRLGYTLNLMTLGGLALAVGILVDDATVTIENMHRHLSMGKPMIQAIVDAAQEIAKPAFVATLSISIVFTSVTLLEGPPRFLFIPMALAVVFAMLFSYFLSRSLVPCMANLLLPLEHSEAVPRRVFEQWIEKAHEVFEERFFALRNSYERVLQWVLENRKKFFQSVFVFFGISACLFPFIGRDFFPVADAGLMRLHVYTPTGTRLETSEVYFAQVEEAIRQLIPPGELETIVDNIGLPVYFSTTLAFSDSMTEGPFDGEILISLKEGHKPTAHYMKRLREELPKRFPSFSFFFQPADMVNQVLNFGVASPIDIRIIGPDEDRVYQIARKVEAAVRRVLGAVDVHLHQRMDYPTIRLDVDRVRAMEFGLTQADITKNILTQLSSSYMVAPTYWVDPKTTISYPLLVFTPQNRIRSPGDLLRLTITPLNGRGRSAFGPESTQTLLGNVQNPLLLANVVKLYRRDSPAVVTHSNMKPALDVYANIQGRDLGGVASDIERVLRPIRKELPPLYRIEVVGQVTSMREAFGRLGLGVAFAVILVYLLMVVNFQSWLDPLIILMALPMGACGILWALFLWHTTFSVPSLMGTIMTVGVATANSILLITFANQELATGKAALQAALEAGKVRLRPVLMTALAMIIGMLPMSLGLSEGGEQNAPLGRAVIGGLLLATVGTLFFVPAVFTFLRGRKAS